MTTRAAVRMVGWRLCMVVLAAAVVDANVVLRTMKATFDPLPDQPADFGPRIPREGVEGILLLADPLDGCSPMNNTGMSDPWIALISRDQEANCTFDQKVLNAEIAGAAAAIVYDDNYEQLIVMSKPRNSRDPNIPSVFVSQKSGIVMKSLMQNHNVTTAEITPTPDAVWMSMLMSAFAGVLAVSVIVATFYFIRRHRIRHLPGRLGYCQLRGNEEGMSEEEMRTLPVVIHESHPLSKRGGGDAKGKARPKAGVPMAEPDLEAGGAGSGSDSEDEGVTSPLLGTKGGGTLKTCAICIEEYKDGEKLRILPCAHRFHMECVDQWLSTRKPLCPICKWDAVKAFPSDHIDGEDHFEEPVPRSIFSRLNPRRWGRWAAPARIRREVQVSSSEAATIRTPAPEPAAPAAPAPPATVAGARSLPAVPRLLTPSTSNVRGLAQPLLDNEISAADEDIEIVVDSGSSAETSTESSAEPSSSAEPPTTPHPLEGTSPQE